MEIFAWYVAVLNFPQKLSLKMRFLTVNILNAQISMGLFIIKVSINKEFLFLQPLPMKLVTYTLSNCCVKNQKLFNTKFKKLIHH
jgi:hypothetical protein